MGQWARAWIACEILTETYPQWLTWKEFFQEAQNRDARRFGCLDDLQQIMGVFNNKRTIYGVQCWREENGKVRYDPTRKIYIRSFQPEFALLFNEWLRKTGRSRLILFEPKTPDNSRSCNLSLPWSKIPHPDRCNWNCDHIPPESFGCTVRCGLDYEKIKAYQRGEIEMDEI